MRNIGRGRRISAKIRAKPALSRTAGGVTRGRAIRVMKRWPIARAAVKGGKRGQRRRVACQSINRRPHVARADRRGPLHSRGAFICARCTGTCVLRRYCRDASKRASYSQPATASQLQPASAVSLALAICNCNEYAAPAILKAIADHAEPLDRGDPRPPPTACARACAYGPHAAQCRRSRRLRARKVNRANRPGLCAISYATAHAPTLLLYLQCSNVEYIAGNRGRDMLGGIKIGLIIRESLCSASAL